MSGRRTHPRYAMLPPIEGSLQLRRDVVVQRAEKGELIAISREPAAVGETITVEIPADRALERLQVRIVGSQPMIVDGSVRHRLQLQPMVETPAPVAQQLVPGERDAERR